MSGQPVVLLPRGTDGVRIPRFQPEGAATLRGAGRLGARRRHEVGPDGTHVTLVERRGDTSRIRMVTMVQGSARTVVESPFLMSAPIARPMRAQMLYRQGGEACGW